MIPKTKATTTHDKQTIFSWLNKSFDNLSPGQLYSVIEAKHCSYSHDFAFKNASYWPYK